MLALYRENQDEFIAECLDRSDADYVRWTVTVVRVIQHDRTHAIHYNAGDSFCVSVSKTIPGALAYVDWEILPIGEKLAGEG